MKRFDRAFWIILALICSSSLAFAVTVNFDTFISGRSSAVQPLGSSDKFAAVQAGVTVYLQGNQVVTLTDSQTLTNKTFNCSSQASCTVRLGTDVTGVLGTALGGTNLSSYTSGGVVCATASGILASSSALTANLPVIGGGAGVCPSSGSWSGNTTKGASVNGSISSGTGIVGDANGNIVSSSNVALLNQVQTWTGAQTFGSSFFTQNPQAGTTYTFQNSDCGEYVYFTNANAITATPPNTLPVNCAVGIIQGGTGRVTVVNGGSGNATYINPFSFTGTVGPGAVIGLLILSNAGGTAATGILTGSGS